MRSLRMDEMENNMKYKFWGWEQANVPAVTDQYKGFGQNNQLLHSPFPDRAVAKRALLSVDGFLCGKV